MKEKPTAQVVRMVRAANRRAERQAPLLALIRRAGEQIDSEPEGQLGWLLRFVREDPKAWMPGDATARGYRLLSFVFRTPPNMLALGPSSHVAPLTTKEVLGLHARLGAFFRRAVSGPAGQPRDIDLPTEGLRECLVRATAPGVKPALFVVSLGGPFDVMLFQRVKQLVLETDRLLACRECGQPFLALRKKLFCTSACALKWHDKRKGDRRIRQHVRLDAGKGGKTDPS